MSRLILLLKPKLSETHMHCPSTIQMVLEQGALCYLSRSWLRKFSHPLVLCIVAISTSEWEEMFTIKFSKGYGDLF
jgi:hypothetical protein